MTRKARQSFLAVGLVMLLGLESVYFLRQFATGVLNLMGEHAFYRNNIVLSWNLYRRAQAWGADRQTVESNQLESILFGLDQVDGGIRIELPLSQAEALKEARNLSARLIGAIPHSAYHWSLASDVYRHVAHDRRRREPIDLSRLSEDPLENMLAEEWLSLACMEAASRLEPRNALYPDLMTEMFLEIGSPANAARYCRRAVADDPELANHLYLWRPELAPEVLEAALQGFQDALAEQTMVSPAAIECDAARLLSHHGQDERARPHLERAVALAPGVAEFQIEMGQLHYRLKEYRKALEFLGTAIAIDPASAWPYYIRGLCRIGLGESAEAIEQFRKAKEIEPGGRLFLYALGEALEKTGQVQDAGRQFVAAAHMNPQDPGGWSSLLAFYARQGDRLSAPDACSRLLALRPEDPAYKEQCAAFGEVP
jgi:tetratricopeptide (TPR) repeat protein